MAYVLEHIKVDSGQYMRPLWRMYFRSNWLWFLLPLLGCALACYVWRDVRWLIAGLMLLFMVFPMLMVLIYINYALTLEVRWSLMEKTLEIDQSGLHFTFTDERMKPRTIFWQDIKAVTRDDGYYYFHLRVRRYNFLMVPRESVKTQGIEERELMRFVRKNMEA